MKIRKTKKFLKTRKQSVQIILKGYNFEKDNKILISKDCDFEFIKYGIIVSYCNISCEFIPYGLIGNIYLVT